MIDRILKIMREINPYVDFDEKTLLIEDGILDSVSLVLLMEKIERNFSISIPEDKFTPDYFESVEKINEMILSIQRDKI